jgi:hypothetical protein
MDQVPDVAGWAEVFPELTGAPDRLQQLLQQVDAVPTDLPAWRAGTAPPAGGSGALESVVTGGRRPFGDLLTAVVAAPVAEAADRLRRLPVLGRPDQVAGRAAELALTVAAEQVTRSLLPLLAAASAAGRLDGATPEARYDAFAAHLVTAAGRGELRARRPDLLPRTEALVRLRLDALVEQLAGTDRHWPAVAARLGLDPGDRVVDVEPGGDAHGGGRCVLLLTTATGARLVMKPRALDVETGYADFAAWLGRTATGLELPVPRAYATATAGWVEHVEPAGADPSPDYHAMVGVHLAALHLLRGTDVHYENLLADAAGRPVVVDAEALFHPVLAGAPARRPQLLGAAATGLLSLPFGGPDGGFDFGALDYRRGARSPFRVWHVQDAFRDDMRLEMRPVAVDHPDAVPAGTPRGAAEAAVLADAFEATTTLVVQERARVLARLEADFRAGRCRYVHRPTMAYALLLRMATHPRFAADADRQRVFGRLAVQQPATPWPLLAAEVRQLTAGEVPAFGVDLHDTRLLDARGRDTGVRTARSPMAEVRAALTGLDASAVADEAGRVRAALAHWTSGDLPVEGQDDVRARRPGAGSTPRSKEENDEDRDPDGRPRPDRPWLDAGHPGPARRRTGGLAGAAVVRR